MKGRVVWVLDEGDAERELRRSSLELLILSGTSRLDVLALILALSLSSVSVCCGDLFGDFVGDLSISFPTASLMDDGTRTQANVRSWVTQPPRMSQARMFMYASLWSLVGGMMLE